MLWGALSNSGSAMQAMSTSLGTISQNVANINTTGYKTAQTLFQTQLSEQLVTPPPGGEYTDPNEFSTAGTSIFGVGTYNRNLISVQGSDVTTGQGNDLAINGSGFFIVAPPVKAAAPTTVSLAVPDSAYYTRDGSFQQVSGDPTDPTANAYYVNGNGDYLMGWMADPATGIIDQSTLVPVYSQPQTTLPAMATTQASVVANVPADAAATPNSQSSSVGVTENGQSQSLTLAWTRVNATTWTVAATGVTGGTVSNASPTYTVTTDGNGNVLSTTDGVNTYTPPQTVPFPVTWADGDVNPADQPAVNLAPLAPTLTTENLDLPVYDTLSNSHTLVMGFEKTGADTWTLHFNSPEMTAPLSSTIPFTDAAGNAAELNLTWTSAGADTWTVTPSGVSGTTDGTTASGSATVTVVNGAITSIDGVAPPPATVNDFTITTPGTASPPQAFDLAGAAPTFPSISTPPVTVTFNGQGRIVSPSSVSVTATWPDGQTTTTAVDISQLTQYTSNGTDTVDVASMTQNGYLSGNLESTSFDANGVMTATYTNGQGIRLFQVPLATFVAPDSLAPVSGNLYQITPGAGAVSVQAVNQVDGGSTSLAVGSLESSTVNLQDQMTAMILAQKAYSMNSQVFQTSDQMTMTARDLQT